MFYLLRYRRVDLLEDSQAMVTIIKAVVGKKNSSSILSRREE
jgi:hypothetical protein